MTDYQDEHPQADAPFFAAADLGDAPLTASAGALFQPIATAPAVSSAEGFERRASEVTLSSDAVVIALAKRVARIARMEARAFVRACLIKEKAEETLPTRPPLDAAREAADAAYKAEIEAVGGIMAYRLDDPIIVAAHARAFQASKAARAPFDEVSRAWEAERACLLEAKEVKAAQHRADRIARRLERAGRSLIEMKPQTVTGCVAMARAAGAVARTGLDGGWSKLLHGCVVRAVAGLQIGAALASDRDTDATLIAPDPRALESYRTWLQNEFRSLTAEMYPDMPHMLGAASINNAGDRFHFRGEPPASSRAEHILAAVGIDWRNDPKASAFRRHEQAA